MDENSIPGYTEKPLPRKDYSLQEINTNPEE